MGYNIKIRIGQPSDERALVEFNIAMARETENKSLSPAVVLAGVRNLLQNPQHGFYIVAHTGEEVAGTLMVTTEWSDWRNGEFWWIQSVYVRPEFRRRGIYRALYEFVKTRAADSGRVCGFRLYVERDNFIAQQTYRKMGMEETPYKILEELLS
ncbi:MAG: GNAT family N-acetyltransferase [Acidiferrobacterales bacterium]